MCVCSGLQLRCVLVSVCFVYTCVWFVYLTHLYSARLKWPSLDVCVCVRACVRACVRVCVCVWLCVCVVLCVWVVLVCVWCLCVVLWGVFLCVCGIVWLGGGSVCMLDNS